MDDVRTGSKLTKNDPWSSMLVKGVVLWRRVRIIDRRFALIEEWGDQHGRQLTFKKDNNRLVAKVLLNGNFIWEPEVMPFKTGKQENQGIILMLDREPQPNWTHLVVTGVSNALRLPGRQDKGGVIFATPAKPYRMSDYIRFRLEMFDAVSNIVLDKELCSRMSHDEKVEIASKVWPRDVRPEITRLFVNSCKTDPELFYEYTHMNDGNDDSVVYDEDDEFRETA